MPCPELTQNDRRAQVARLLDRRASRQAVQSVDARRRHCWAVMTWRPSIGARTAERQVLCELDQRGGAGRADGDVVGGEAAQGVGGEVLAGPYAGEEPSAG